MEQDNAATHERFLTLFTVNEPAIRAFVRRLVPTRQDAADVMQSVALVLWRKFRELEEPDEFRKWAFGVARYETLTWLRDKARDRLVLADDVLNTVAHESGEIDCRLSAQREALEACLESLPGEQKALVLAAYAPKVRIQDIAERSGRSVAAFYQWLHRVRLRLLECTRRTLHVEGVL